MRNAPLLVLTASLLAGCASGVPILSLADPRPPGGPRETWSLVPPYGLVRGSAEALASLDTPGIGTADHPVAETCRAAVEAEARGFAPARAEVLQATFAEPDGAGLRSRVVVRVIYAHPLFLEVRLAALACRVDAWGRPLAWVAAPEA